jgi:hypothetical protein
VSEELKPEEQTPQDDETREAAAKPVEPVEIDEDEIIYPNSTIPPLPPEVKGEANGGPLGCCLGMLAGMLFFVLLVFGLPLLITNGGYSRTLTALAIPVGIVVGGFIGWKLGKRFYKEYEPPVVKRKKRKKVRR